MESMQVTTQVLGILGAVVDVAMYLSPVVDVIRLCKTRKVEDVSELIFVLFLGVSATYSINFIRKFDLIALSSGFIGAVSLSDLSPPI